MKIRRIHIRGAAGNGEGEERSGGSAAKRCDWPWDKPQHVHHTCKLENLNPGGNPHPGVSHTCECGATY
jgi:hypothetical protein